MRNVTIVIDKAGEVVDQGRIMASQVRGITLATDGNKIRDYRADDGYQLVFAGPENKSTDYRPYGGFIMHMIEERRWRAAEDAATMTAALPKPQEVVL